MENREKKKGKKRKIERNREANTERSKKREAKHPEILLPQLPYLFSYEILVSTQVSASSLKIPNREQLNSMHTSNKFTKFDVRIAPAQFEESHGSVCRQNWVVGVEFGSSRVARHSFLVLARLEEIVALEW